MRSLLRVSCAAILFDLDGVLVDSNLVVERTWRRWAELRNVRVPELTSRAHGRRSIETVREVAPHLDADAEVQWLAAAELSDFEGVVALPGAVRALNTVHDREWAIVTSGGRDLAQRRLAHGNLPIPAVLVAAEDVIAGKPAPEGYLLAAARLGVDPSTCVVIEDTVAGIQAGRLAGAQVLALTTTFPRADLKSADLIAASLTDVRLSRSGTGLILEVVQGDA